jgi:hypothetical protein
MTADDSTSFFSSQYDSSNFLKVLERLGPCINHSGKYSPKAMFPFRHWNQMPKENVVLAYECGCNKLISIKPRLYKKTIDISFLGLAAGLEHLKKKLPQNHKIVWWQFNDAYLKATIEIWEYDVHSAWIKPGFFFGRRYNFLLSCHDCGEVKLIEIKDFLQHPHCRVIASAPMGTLSVIRQLDINVWRHLLWHKQLEHEHHIEWGEKVETI